MSFRSIYKKILLAYSASKKKDLDKEFILYRIYRPLSFPITAYLIRIGLSANQVTFLSFINILLCFYLLYIGTPLSIKFASAVYALAFILDFADGNIARFYNKSNYFGKMIDGFVDAIGSILFTVVAYANIKSNMNILSVELELLFGVSTTIILLLLYYYRMRVSYLLLESKIAGHENEPEAYSKKGYKQLIVGIFNKLYKNIAVSTPLLLLVFAMTNLLSVFIIMFFLLHLILGTSEIIVSLIGMNKRLNVYREY